MSPRFPQAGWSKTYQPPPRDPLDALFWLSLAGLVFGVGYTFWVVFRALKGWPI